MLPIMNPDDDYLTIVAAEEKIASSEAKRKKELEEIHTNLKCSFMSFPNPISHY
jgi:kinetochore protein Spc24